MRHSFAVLATLVWLVAVAPAAPAATFAVNSTGDLGDASPGNGVCATSGGVCTLRAAVQEGNALPGSDTARLPAGDYATNNLTVSGPLVVDGAGGDATVVRVFGFVARAFDASAPLELRDLTVRDGNVSGCGGAVRSSAAVTVRNAVLRNNRAFAGGTDGACGGAISVAAALLIENSRMLSNTSEATGVGGSFGGAISVGGPSLTMRDSTFVENRAIGNAPARGHGGVIYTSSTSALIERSFVSGNSADEAGGAIFNDSGALTLRASTVESNGVGSYGAGLYTGGPLTVENSTITGNIALGSPGIGGGIYVWESGSLAATHMTMGGNLAVGIGDGIAIRNATATLRASILHNTPEGNCRLDGGTGSFVSQGFNVESGTTCGLTGPGDRPSTDAQLPPLADNGGPTVTHALPASSPAVNLVSSGCPPPATDQRGVARPQLGACDAGAFERTPDPIVPAPPPPPAPATASDTVAPVIGGLSLSRRRFRVGRRPTAKVARRRRAPVGTIIRFRLSEPALTLLRTQRRTAGLRLHVRGRRRCLPASMRNRRRLARQVTSPRLRRRARCSLWRGTGALSRRAAAGPSSVAWSGRIGRRALRPGTYRLWVRAFDDAGNRSAIRLSRTFRIVGR